jgi:uncharacterized protein
MRAASFQTALWLISSILLLAPAHAQVAPGASEIAAYTGLHRAAAQGDIPALQTLLASRPNLEQVDGNGRTAIHIAGHGSHTAAVRLLAAAGANMRAKDSQHYDLITIAAVKNDRPMLELALELGGDARAITSPYEGTALIAAAHLGHAEVTRILVAAKAPLDHVNNLGWTAAIEAVVLGDGGPAHQATLQALIDGGANTKIADRQGATPLDLARARGFTAMVRMLERAR